MTQILKYVGIILLGLMVSNIALADGPPPPPGNNPRQVIVNLFLQGFYEASLGEMRKAQDHDGINPYDRYNGEIAEKIMIVFHSNTSPYDSITGGWVNLNKNGQAGFELSSDFNDNYYIVVRPRNHLETWSAASVSFAGTGLVEYDFTTAADKAYGNNIVQLTSGVYGIYAGDVTMDGALSGADLVAATDQVRLGANGYIVEDVNGDGVMSGADLVQITDNIRLGIALIAPD